jgi:hypothetical protein
MVAPPIKESVMAGALALVLNKSKAADTILTIVSFEVT